MSLVRSIEAKTNTVARNRSSQLPSIFIPYNPAIFLFGSHLLFSQIPAAILVPDRTGRSASSCIYDILNKQLGAGEALFYELHHL